MQNQNSKIKDKYINQTSQKKDKQQFQCDEIL